MKNSEGDAQKSLIVEHALLVSEISDNQTTDEITKARERLSRIERELRLTPSAIASKAIAIYKARY